MSGVIVYSSSYGSTKQYAEWIRDETGFPMFESNARSIPWEAKTVVIGCPIIANKPFLLGWMQKNWDKLRDKNVILFTTSGADPEAEPVADWIHSSLTEEMRKTIRAFPLPGRFQFSQMSTAHKAMLRIGAVVMRSAEIKHQIKNPVDGVSRDRLAPLLAVLKDQA